MCQLYIVVFAMYFRLVLSVEHEPEIARARAPATPFTRHWQPGYFLFREVNGPVRFFCILTIAPADDLNMMYPPLIVLI